MGAARSFALSDEMSSDLEQTVSRARRRVGALSVNGRYHKAPHKLEDKYTLENTTLGTGYNGSVMRCRRKRSNDRYAVKHFELRGVDHDKLKELANEVEIILSMDHPNVVRLMEVYETGRGISLVMECCEGGELFARVSQVKVFPEKEAAVTTQQMLLALNYIHTEGIVHRDLKLENFMYDQQDSDFLKLIDFGFSKFFKQGQTMDESLGTVTYVAPEVLSKSYAQGSCDLWSMGVIVFILLSGCMPFMASSDAAIMRAIRRGAYQMHATRWGGITEAAKDFVRRLLVVDPSKRMTAQEALKHEWLSQVRFADRATDAGLVLPAVQVCQAFSGFAKSTEFHKVCMQMMAWSLPLDERRKLRYTFLAMDKTCTGVLNLSELHDFLVASSLGQDEVDMVLRAFDELDTDHDGDVHYSDFLAAMMCPRLKLPDDDVLHDAFRRFDTEHRGYLTQRQLEDMLGGRLEHEDIERIFETVDGNHDGHLDLDEFVAYAQGSFKTPCNQQKAMRKAKSAKQRVPSPPPRLLGRTRIAQHLGCFAVAQRAFDKLSPLPTQSRGAV